VNTLPDDSELVDLLQKGSLEAFDLIYGKYSSKLYLFSLKYLKSEAEAEELVQSVFLTVWEHRKELKKQSSFKSFLFTITYNRICNTFKARKYHQKYINDKLIEDAQITSDYEENINYRLALEHVKKVIDSLPEKQRAIFTKSRFENKSTKEIAEELGLSIGTVDNYISESLKIIRRKCQFKGFSILLFFSMFIT